MSRASTSLDLSEFFSNDDSDGHRLAEYLQKRRGGVQRQNFLFMNCETQRLSLNVQLEKLPHSQQETACENNGNQKKNVEECVNNGDANASIEKEMATLHGEEEVPSESLSACSNKAVTDKDPKDSNIGELPSKNVFPISPRRPLSPSRPQSPIIPLSPSRPQSPINPLSPSRPLSPRLSSIRKSGGVSPGDRLRRYSLKRLSKMCVGRRTLLQEFESTVSETNFEPPVCSTPLSQPQQDKTLVSSPTSSNSPGTENLEPNATENNSPATNDTCCGHTDTLIRTLQRKDEELKNYMESILENTLKKIQTQEKENNKNSMTETNATNSPLKRTYTMERGNSPGQVILTPDRDTAAQSPPPGRLLRSRTQPSPSKILKTPERSKNRSMISIRVKSPHNVISPRHLNKSISHMEQSRTNQSNNTSQRAAKMLEVSRSHSQQQHQNVTPNLKRPDHEVPNTPPRNNVSIVFPTQDVEIPETQEVPFTKENSIAIQSANQEIPLVVIPINQTFNRTYGEDIPKNNYTIITAKTKQSKTPSPVPLEEITPQQTANVNNEDQCNQLNEDNLKLTDILTEDEDETPKAAVSRTIENNSQAPLNLAPSATNIRTKRLRKRSFSRRKLQMDNSQLLSTETETEPPPPAHTSKRMVKRKYIPLNRAPGTPLNGERFAQELARMSNYEILDLRKRNSMGRVFAISGRKSVRSHEEAAKKQTQLDNQIEMELLRRNLDEAAEQEVAQNETENMEEVGEYPPAPDEFRDSMAKQQQVQGENLESSLVDERSTDRISFKNRNSLKQQKQRKSKAKEKQLPDVLKQYLEGHSDSEETNSSPEKMETTRSSSRNNKQSIPYVPSPPKSDGDQITTLKVVSPPPPLSISTRKSVTRLNKQNTRNEVEENSSDTNTTISEAIPPPPPGFESDSGVSSNHFSIHPSTTTISNNNNNTLPTEQITNNTTQQMNKNNSHTDNDDDKIFKKPLQPAPKVRGRKPKVSKTSSSDLVQSTSDSHESTDNSTDTTDGSLRRSKRGQVPLKHSVPHLFQMLFQQANKRMEIREKNKERQKQKSRELSKANRAKHNNNTIQSVSSQKLAKKRNQLPTVPENDPYIAPLVEDVHILTKKKATKIKETKVKRKQNKKSNKDQIQPNDHIECSRIVMNKPPPVDHLNNVFDQLRNTSSTLNTSPPRPPEDPMQLASSSCDLVQKVKPLKVRVARIKSSSQPAAYDAVHVSSSTTTNNNTAASSSSNNNNSNYELISWLKNISESDNSVARNEEIFKEMRISAASNLSFTELQGVEYAFYDTDEKASLGYLRFKPRQIKPKKKAKRFHLHFVTLVGNFRITANDKESRVGVGDMVAIEKSVYYDIENITDDIGILMVIKK
ncbi:probable WRKY transcription factor protein 1 isoform X2 [Lucilia sericata]|uniref:probable WRKY transcription factor protein 1 isoform X2 n=1 Tax=Lucilia sericata TaxID=13632 RepID=UPI0018A846C8|nr:probable WRKY transcription factor protein 1 isoform X2 [Lucilia sericata]